MKTHEFRPRHLIALLLTVALTVPLFALSAGATDALPAEEPQKITDTLTAVMEESTEETTRVAVWLRDIDSQEALATESMPDYEARLAAIETAEANSTATNEIDRSIEVKRTALNLCYEPYTAFVAEDLLDESEVVYASRYLPVVIAELSDERVAEVAEAGVVEKMDYCNDEAEEEVVEECDVMTATEMASTSSHFSVESNSEFVKITDALNVINQKIQNGEISSMGRTLSIGFLEYKLPFVMSPVFDNVRENIYFRRETDLVNGHATHDLEILISPNLPNVHYYCTSMISRTTANFLSEMEWLIDRGVNLISISDRLLHNVMNDYTLVDEIIDRFIPMYNVTMVLAAGNRDDGGENQVWAGALSYNSIVVGNYNRTMQTIDFTSSYYNNTVWAYKPDISAPGYFDLEAYICTMRGCKSEACANGTCIDGAACGNACLHTEDTCCTIDQDQQLEGTSQATPLVSAAISVLLWYAPGLKDKPDLVKAIVTASVTKDSITVDGTTYNLPHYTTDQSGYRQCGAGIVNALNMISIISPSFNCISSSLSSVSSVNTHSVALQAGTTERISFVVEKNSWLLADNGGTAEDTYASDSGLRNYYIKVYGPSGNLLYHKSVSNTNVIIMEFTPTQTGYYTIKVGMYDSEGSSAPYGSLPYAIAVT